MKFAPNEVMSSLLLVIILCICRANLATAQPRLNFLPVVTRMSRPLEIKNAGDGSGRLFIVEQTGRIAIVKDGRLQRRPFLDLSAVVQKGPLTGLWSIAFPPGYTESRFFFVYYIDTSGNTIVARYRTSQNNPDVADPNSGVVLFSWPGRNTGGPKFGQLHFGPDNYLYISVSDGSFYDATTTFAQVGRFPYGKILRIDIRLANAPYYRIPPDNPFVNNPNVLNEIWAIGLRNAWRWCFDRETNTMFIADDGNEKWEELDIVTIAQSRAANFGWPCYEGNEAFDTTGCGRPSRYTFPAFTYAHDIPTGGSTTIGGYVYRGIRFPQLRGRYIFSDFFSNNLWVVTPAGSGEVNTVLQSGIPPNIAGYGEDEDGELYAASLDGIVYAITATSSVTDYSQGSDAVSKTVKATITPTLVDAGKITLLLDDGYDLFRLFDMTGHEIMTQKLTGMGGNVLVNLPDVPAGMYFVQITGKQSVVQKIVVTR